MTKNEVLAQLIKIGGPNADKVTQSIFDMNMSAAKTADVLAYTAKTFGWTAAYQKVVADWIKSIAPPAPSIPPVVPPVTVPAPVPGPVTGFYVDGGGAAREADALEREGRRDEAGWVRKAIAEKAQGIWYNGGSVDHIATACSAAKSKNQAVILVAYNIPDRDAGNFSKGGAVNLAQYKVEFDAFCAAIGTTTAYVCIEPDATNLPDFPFTSLRRDCLNYAMDKLSKIPNVKAYINAGHSNWRGLAEMAERLNSLTGPSNLGISLNVSSWQSTASSIAYGKNLVARLFGSSKRMIIDTSRNGMERHPVNEWANVWDSKAGRASTTETGDAAVDALLWVKRLGESDGKRCKRGSGIATGLWLSLKGHWGTNRKWPSAARG